MQSLWGGEMKGGDTLQTTDVHRIYGFPDLQFVKILESVED